MPDKTTDPVIAARTDVANAVRLSRDPAPARRALETAKLARAIRHALASPSAPSSAQRQELMAILSGRLK